MGYMTDGLTFNTLRRANMKRLPGFKNGKGVATDHTRWRATDWVCAVTGELGELANLVKKIHRGDFTIEDVRQELADELADVGGGYEVRFRDLEKYALASIIEAAADRLQAIIAAERSGHRMFRSKVDAAAALIREVAS